MGRDSRHTIRPESVTEDNIESLMTTRWGMSIVANSEVLTMACKRAPEITPAMDSFFSQTEESIVDAWKPSRSDETLEWLEILAGEDSSPEHDAIKVNYRRSTRKQATEA